jgi:streptomycin 6-kinase
LERLTASPRIMDIYGYCATTTRLEFMPEEIEKTIEPGNGRYRANQTELDMLDNVYPRNDLTAMEKLVMALEMAEALADLHGFKDGVILHGDLHHCQFLKNSEGKIKLGDFNLATILEWNDKEEHYCKRKRKEWCFEVRCRRLSSLK